MKEFLRANQLDIATCRSSVEKWANDKSDFLKIKNYVDPKNVYCFNKETLEWVKANNGNDYFYLFAAVYENKLTFIITTTDKTGQLDEHQSYNYLSPAYLDEDIRLVENTNIRKVTTLTKQYFLLHDSLETINLFSENDTSISEEKAVVRIKSWLENSMDWFFHECTDFKGQRIFNSFKVPLFDLNNNKNIEKVYCIFGLKRSYIYNMLVPVMNFIGVNKNNKQLGIVSSDLTNNKTNISDFSSPCPPFCKEKVNFPGL